MQIQYILPAALTLACCLCSCNQPPSAEQLKAEIADAEAAFAQMAADSGIGNAFLHYAADDAVLMRRGELVAGHEALVNYFQNPGPAEGVSLTWEPDFIDVANPATWRYTYGHYVYSFPDTSGRTVSDTGIFHTVWKRQPNGEWKFVWD